MNIVRKADWTDLGESSLTVAQRAPNGFEVNFSEIVGIIRRQGRLIASVTALAFTGSVIYVALAEPRFTAAATLMIDPQLDLLDKKPPSSAFAGLDLPLIESQVQLLQSEKIALNVVKKLNLQNDPEFVEKRAGLVGYFKGALQPLISDNTGSAGPDSGVVRSEWLAFLGRYFQKTEPTNEEDKLHAAIWKLWDNLHVKRLGMTYTFEIAYTAADRSRAAQIANAYADAYVLDQLESRYQAAQKAAQWLQARIVELEEQAKTAEDAVQEYKIKNNIVVAGSRLLNEQQVAELSTQLTAAHSQMAEIKARLDRIREINSAGTLDASTPDTIRNEAIIRLREQYYEASKREAEWSAKYGQNHPAAANLRNEMKEIQEGIAEELRHVEQAYQNDYEIVRARVDSLQASLDKVSRENIKTGSIMTGLKNLESAAQASRHLYGSFLQRLNETQQQQTLPTTQARVITDASLNTWRSYPQALLTTALATILSGMAGIGLALMREQFDSAFRSPSQVESITEAPCLGVLPKIGASKRFNASSASRLQDRILVSEGVGMSRYAIEHPFSRYAEVMRFVKVAADLSRHGQCKLIGVVSALPNEGKSTVASNLAHLMAQGGSRTLLMDADLRNSALTRQIAPDASAGLMEAMVEKAGLDEAVWTDAVTNLRFLPTVAQDPVANTSDILSSDAMRDLLARAREQYDYVVVDLPPILPVADAVAASYAIDSFVFVVEWGATTQKAVQEALAATAGLSGKILGTVMNKADGSVLKRLEAYKGRHFNRYYGS